MDSRFSFRLLVLALFLSFLQCSGDAGADGCFSAVFSVGDSLADTGNLLHDIGDSNAIRVGQLPYGETYFRRPTGRFSDGRLIVDFIAQAVGVPLLPPYREGLKSLKGVRGVNFAVAGATAVNNSFYAERGIQNTVTNSSLGVQMQWLKQLLPSLCSSPSDCKHLIHNSLFLVGEIGGNDYNYAFFQGRTLKEVTSFVPRVIAAISSAITDLIEMGARVLVVPGDLPIGCNSAYLTAFHSDRAEDYSDIGCIDRLNDFAKHHNRLLHDELHRLRRLHPQATIIYADYYNAAMSLFRSTADSGSGANLSACCGGGGPYNYNVSLPCGAPGATVCDDPSKYVTWDGLHMTEAAYGAIAEGLLTGSYASPSILWTCGKSQRKSNGTP